MAKWLIQAATPSFHSGNTDRALITGALHHPGAMHRGFSAVYITLEDKGLSQPLPLYFPRSCLDCVFHMCNSSTCKERSEERAWACEQITVIGLFNTRTHSTSNKVRTTGWLLTLVLLELSNEPHKEKVIQMPLSGIMPRGDALQQDSTRLHRMA